MEDKFNLKRFVDAQSYTYDRALKEIKSGRKLSHWMWFVFPQFHGLGNSSISKEFSLKSKEEAISYLSHPILGPRLIEITEVFLSLENKTAFELLGRPDDLKMNSSMTLFATIQSEIDLFDSIIQKYFEGKICSLTVRMLEDQ